MAIWIQIQRRRGAERLQAMEGPAAGLETWQGVVGWGVEDVAQVWRWQGHQM